MCQNVELKEAEESESKIDYSGVVLESKGVISQLEVESDLLQKKNLVLICARNGSSRCNGLLLLVCRWLILACIVLVKCV